MSPIFFSSQQEFRKWLAKNQKKETVLFVDYYKVVMGKPSMTLSLLARLAQTISESEKQNRIGDKYKKR